MFRLVSHVVRKTVCVGVIAASLTAIVATAQTAPATGLGQSWPNAPDVSVNPHWHAFVFERDGVRYIQINDRNGTVHAVIGRVGDTLFALPVGVDARRVDAAPALSAETSSQTVYQDDTMTVMAAPQSDGTVQIMVRALGCDDPGACNVSSVVAY
ncbi:hypothetical protein GCM10007862_20670 [Dyella lipolytica]|uniref:Thiol:disulfide interchange protein DsbD N-terminal domain-containing protein n=1 Tax=Dyella lipolytica TaxID=1867835 RepID=A0ABW8ITY4_9GAMM|nr:hypothetical protein [Dyella lipolytica]GLQ47016.1 hypothetical protein GCM10007862_20670 [Dyella lipolytica]